MSILRRRAVRTAVAAATACTVVALAGCGSNGIQSIPLPGGVDTGSDARTYLLQFEDVLDLVPQSVVKQNGIPVGRVVSIEVPPDQWYAQVKVKVKKKGKAKVKVVGAFPDRKGKATTRVR